MKQDTDVILYSTNLAWETERTYYPANLIKIDGVGIAIKNVDRRIVHGQLKRLPKVIRRVHDDHRCSQNTFYIQVDDFLPEWVPVDHIGVMDRVSGHGFEIEGTGFGLVTRSFGLRDPIGYRNIPDTGNNLANTFKQLANTYAQLTGLKVK